MFFAESDFVEDALILIESDEATHILRSRRLQLNDGLSLTNGKGDLGLAIVNEINTEKNCVVVSVQKCGKIALPRVKIILASAIPMGERQSVLLDMVTQLGVNQYIPLLCERSVVNYHPKAHKRWQWIIISASKQSR